jgi:hypothetical protein
MAKFGLTPPSPATNNVEPLGLVHHSGGWYDFGYLLGAAIFLSGGGASST